MASQGNGNGSNGHGSNGNGSNGNGSSSRGSVGRLEAISDETGFTRCDRSHCYCTEFAEQSLQAYQKKLQEDPNHTMMTAEMMRPLRAIIRAVAHPLQTHPLLSVSSEVRIYQRESDQRTEIEVKLHISKTVFDLWKEQKEEHGFQETFDYEKTHVWPLLWRDFFDMLVQQISSAALGQLKDEFRLSEWYLKVGPKDGQPNHGVGVERMVSSISGKFDLRAITAYTGRSVDIELLQEL